MKNIFFLLFALLILGCNNDSTNIVTPKITTDTAWNLIYHNDSIYVTVPDSNSIFYYPVSLDLSISTLAKVTYRYTTDEMYSVIGIQAYAFDTMFSVLKYMFNPYAIDSPISQISNKIPSNFRISLPYSLSIQNIFPGRYFLIRDLKIYKK
jgi:hypothetical protein